jgi:ribosomal protein S18 acetylase RimI-like enzyme
MIVRRGGHQDVRFLRDMLHHAFYWREHDQGSTAMRYVRAWGRPGDTAIVALEDGFPVGAAWFRLFPPDDPGYGYVDDHTPELAIAVVPSRRGHGIGDALLSALLERAREAGHTALSLSVDSTNEGAIRLYEKHGFERAGDDGDSVTMVAKLRPDSGP